MSLRFQQTLHFNRGHAARARGGNRLPIHTVLHVARHSETQEEHVVYRQEYGDNSVWIRPLAMFVELVIVDGKTMPRFEKMD